MPDSVDWLVIRRRTLFLSHLEFWSCFYPLLINCLI
jgi:hypothetical protein